MTKSTFLWAVAVGIALTGGLSGLAWLLFSVALFWFAGKVYDGASPFIRGFKLGMKRPTPGRNRPTLRVIKGGA